MDQTCFYWFVNNIQSRILHKEKFNITPTTPPPAIISIWWTCPLYWILPCSLLGSSATFPIIATEVFSSLWHPWKRPGARNFFLMPSDGYSHCQRQNNPMGYLAFVTVWYSRYICTLWTNGLFAVVFYLAYHLSPRIKAPSLPLT